MTSLCDVTVRACCRDIAPEGRTLAESNANLDEVVALALELQREAGVRPLWGTAQLFKHPRCAALQARGVPIGTWAMGVLSTWLFLTVCIMARPGIPR